MGEFDADLALFRDSYLASLEVSKQYLAWRRDNCGKARGGTPSAPAAGSDAQLWDAFRVAVLADQTPSPPDLATAIGDSFVAAGRMHMSISRIVAQMVSGSPPVPPSPAPWTGPIVITSGGLYSGSWESTSPSTPAVKILTTTPVTITGRVRNLFGGTLIDAVDGGAVQVTLDHVLAYGGDTYQTSGRWFQAEAFKSIVIRNCTIENTRGIELAVGAAASSAQITRNRHLNIKGNGTLPVGNFVQFRVCQNTMIEISWNEILNEYDLSNPEDIISLYHTSNAQVLDNFLRHQSKPGNAYNTSSQGSITLDASTPGPGCHNNNILRNQVIDAMGITGYFDQGGNNNLFGQNRVIADRLLPNGQIKGNGDGSALTVRSGGSNNHAHGNVVGYIDRDGDYINYELVGTPEGQAGELANNTVLSQGSVTAAAEAAEFTSWEAKLVANGIVVGA